MPPCLGPVPCCRGSEACPPNGQGLAVLRSEATPSLLPSAVASRGFRVPTPTTRCLQADHRDKITSRSVSSQQKPWVPSILMLGTLAELRAGLLDR